MADYIRFRLSAAKAGVTMAFFALLGGLIGPAEGEQGGPSARPASFSWGAHYLKLDGLNGATQKVFQKLELKLNEVFHKVNQTLTSNYYDKHRTDVTFLKIRDANDKWLKITDANANFLKITDANANFLKITDANQKFLKIDGIAADSNKLGGLTPDAFVQGRGDIISGAVGLNGDGTPAPLVRLPNGIIAVSVALSPGAQVPTVIVHNGTGALLPAVQTSAGNSTSADLKPNSDTALTLNGRGPAYELQLQILPNAAGGFNDAVSVLVALEPNPNNNGQYSAVGQMLIGLL